MVTATVSDVAEASPRPRGGKMERAPRLHINHSDLPKDSESESAAITPFYNSSDIPDQDVHDPTVFLFAFNNLNAQLANPKMHLY